jgi:hypothetical protein
MPCITVGILSTFFLAVYASACSFSTSLSYDLNGGDLPSQPVSTTVSSLEECASLCCAAGFPCSAFSLNAGAPGSRWCYLKYASGWSNTSTPGVDSGILSNPLVSYPWFNCSLPRGQRISALVSAMTLDEQISWLDDGCPAIPRLGLPSYSWEAEALHGVAWAGVATVFPEPIALGASFDVELVSQVASVVALEARAKWVSSLASDGSSAEFYGLSFMVRGSLSWPRHSACMCSRNSMHVRCVCRPQTTTCLLTRAGAVARCVLSRNTGRTHVFMLCALCNR